MDRQTSQLIRQLKENPDTAKALLSSGDGQALLSMLSGDGGRSLRQAAAEAAKGNTGALSAMLSGVMRSPEGAALIQRINEAAHRQKN